MRSTVTRPLATVGAGAAITPAPAGVARADGHEAAEPPDFSLPFAPGGDRNETGHDVEAGAETPADGVSDQPGLFAGPAAALITRGGFVLSRQHRSAEH